MLEEPLEGLQVSDVGQACGNDLYSKPARLAIREWLPLPEMWGIRTLPLELCPQEYITLAVTQGQLPGFLHLLS